MLGLYFISQSSISGWKPLTSRTVVYNPIGIPLIIEGKLSASTITGKLDSVNIKAKLKSIQITGKLDSLSIRAIERRIQLRNF